MSYVVLARKWRPQRFDDLTGQEHVAQTLQNAIAQGRVPHALLMTGARGVGKTSAARILAMALNCAEGPAKEPCGVCSSCEEVQRGQSVDVLEIDGASNRGINEIRELRDGVRYAPSRDRYKVYIIDEVHMLTTEAFNALLKTLEEPPPHVVFIFATTEAQKIPVTILSRCQRFDFRRISHPAIVGRLRHITDAEGIDVDADVLGVVARQAAGGMRDALSLLDQVIAFAGTTIRLDDAATILGVAERRRLFQLSDALIRHDVEEALKVVDEIEAFGVDIPYFAMEVVSHLRDLTIVTVAKEPLALTALTDGELADALAQVARTDIVALQRMFEIMVDAAEGIARSNQPRLLLEMAIVKLAAIEPAMSIDALIAQLEALSEGRTLPTPSAATPPATARTTREGAPQPEKSAPKASAPEKPAPERPAPEKPAPKKSASEKPVPEEPAPKEAAAERLAPEEPAPWEDAPEKPTSERSEPVQATPEPESVASADDAPESAPDLPPHPQSGAGSGSVLMAAAWRGLVDTLRAERSPLGELLAKARVDATPGAATLHLSDALASRVPSTAMPHLTALALEQHGIEVAFSVAVDAPGGPPEGAYHVVGEEAAERAAHEAAVRRFVEEHETTRRLLDRFPDGRVAAVHVQSVPSVEVEG